MNSIDLFCACDLAQISQDGKLSVLGIFDRIYISDFPSNYPRFFVVAMISGEAYENSQVQLTLTSPSGKEVMQEQSLTSQFGGNGKANIISEMVGVAFEEVGEHLLKLQINNGPQKEFVLSVTKIHSLASGSKPSVAN